MLGFSLLVVAVATLIPLAAARATVILTELRLQDPTQQVELFNTGPNPVQLDELGLDVVGGTIFPLGNGTINAGEFVVISLSNPAAATSLITIRRRGDCIELFDSAFADVPLDRVDTGDSGGAPLDLQTVPNSTIARVNPNPDPIGSQSARFWTIDPTGTLGAANDAQIPALGTSLRINEVIPSDGPGPVVVELFNPTGDAQNLNGWSLTTGIAAVPLFGSINPGDFRIFQIEAGEFTFSLNAYLIEPDEVRVDQIGLVDAPGVPDTYSSVVGTGESFQRAPDGAGPSDGFDLPSSGFPSTLQVCLETPDQPNTGCRVGVPAFGWQAGLLGAMLLLALGGLQRRRRAGSV